MYRLDYFLSKNVYYNLTRKTKTLLNECELQALVFGVFFSKVKATRFAFGNSDLSKESFNRVGYIE